MAGPREPPGQQAGSSSNVVQDEDVWIDTAWPTHEASQTNAVEIKIEDDLECDFAPATALYPEPYDRQTQIQEWAKDRTPSPAPEREEPFHPKGHLFPRGLWDVPIIEEVYLRATFYRTCLYYERDMAKMHKEMRRPEIALSRRELDIPPAPPRPKLPVNGRWRKWFEPFITTEPTQEELRGKTPKIQGYADIREWFNEMRKFGKGAQVWVLNRRDEYFRCRYHMLAKEAAKQQLANAPDNFDYIKAIFPTALPSKVYKSDSSAPPLLRHHHWWTYARVPSHGTRGYYLIQSNVDYIPPLPPACFRRLRINGFYGPHELLWYAQWHQVGLWHLAFIQTCRSGLVHEALHTELKPHRIELYKVNVHLDFEALGNKRFRLRPALFRVFGQAFTAIVEERDAMKLPTWTLLTRPHEAELVFSRGLQYLAEQQVTERDALETTAALQRSIGELRAWNRYMSKRKTVEMNRPSSNKSVPMGADLRIERFRQYTRGVFTEDEHVAKLYAQYGVPVFYVRHMTTKYWVPDPLSVEVQVQALQCETRAYEDTRSLSAFAPLQEYGPAAAAATPVSRPLPLGFAHQHHAPGPSNDVGSWIAPQHAQAHDESMQIDDDGPLPYNNNDFDLYAPAADEGNVREGKGKRAESPHRMDVDPKEDVPSGAQKRKGAPEAAGQRTKKKRKADKTKTEKKKFPMPKGPGKRARDLPQWWPIPWTVALESVRAINTRDLARVEKLQIDIRWPVPKDQSRAMTYASPVVDQFGSKDALPATISIMFATLVQLYPFLLYTISSTSVRDLQRWSAKWWKEILKHKVHPQMQPAFAERLGLDVRSSAIVDVSDNPDPSSFDMTLPATLQEESLATTAGLADVDQSVATATSVASSSEPQAPATGRISRAHNYASDSEDDYGDDDDDIDMTRIESPSAPPAPPKYFVPLGSTIAGPPLSPPGQRYLKEPDGWRFKGKGQARGLDDFIWFLEEDGDLGGLEFVAMGAAVRTVQLQKRTTEVWWDYENGRAFVFTEHPSAREGPLDGERLTQPLRLFQWDGGKRPQYVLNTQTTPLQLRLWRAQDMSQRVVVPSVPLGPVGSRTRCRSVKTNFLLNDESYAQLYPNTPRTVARAQLQPDDEEQRLKGTTSVTALAAPISAAPPDGPSAPTPAPTSSSASTSAVPAPLIGPPTAKQAAKRAFWQEQGFEDVPRTGAPMPLRDALKPSREMEFNGQKLTPYEPPEGRKDYSWPSDEERAWIVWHVAELDFRLELLTLDDFLRTTFADNEKLTAQSNIERNKSLCAIWGSDSIVPRSENPLLAPRWQDRVSAVRAFAAVVSTWPRVSLLEHADEFDAEAEFMEYEQCVWSAYARTYADYYLREAPVPLHRPGSPSSSSS